MYKSKNGALQRKFFDPVMSLSSCSPDQPSIDVPEEIVSDENLELTCYAPDNCPEMTPEIQWMYTDYLPDPEFSTDYLEESNTAVLSSTLTFIPRPMHNGQLLGCRVYYPNTTLVYERLVSLDVKCKFKELKRHLSDMFKHLLMCHVASPFMFQRRLLV